MKTMKSLVLSLVAIAMLSPVYGFRQFNVPKGQNGEILSGDGYGGVEYAIVTTSNTETVVFSGPGVFYGVIMSSGVVASDYVVFKDTNTTSNAATTSPRINRAVAGNVTIFDMPIRVTNGLVVDSFVASTANDFTYIILYVDESL